MSSNELSKDSLILEDEANPVSSEKRIVYLKTSIDSVYDFSTPENKSLRTIIEELKQEIITGGLGNIVFPVTSVNGKSGDVQITPKDLGLDQVDNTADINKPLSTPQRDAILRLLEDYDFNVDLSDLYDHINNTNNPHSVTLEQLNVGDELKTFVVNIIQTHNISTLASTHPDIRRGISGLWNAVDKLTNQVELKLNDSIVTMTNHYNDANAHFDLFEKKQDIAARVNTIMDGSTTSATTYPSSKAVYDFVTTSIKNFKSTLPDVQQWVDEIVIVDHRSDVPEASETTNRKVYIIRYGSDSHGEIAICKQQETGFGYEWHYYPTAPYTKWNPDYFEDSERGVSINLEFLIKAIMADKQLLLTVNDMVNKQIPIYLGDNYYTKDEIDADHFIGDIDFEPGTQDGTFRFYINNNKSTMSEDIKIAGLQRIAFMEYVNEEQIEDQAIHSRHILSRAIEKRHIAERAVQPYHLTASFNTILGNIADMADGIVTEIPLEDLANALVPYLTGKL